MPPDRSGSFAHARLSPQPHGRRQAQGREIMRLNRTRIIIAPRGAIGPLRHGRAPPRGRRSSGSLPSPTCPSTDLTHWVCMKERAEVSYYVPPATSSWRRLTATSPGTRSAERGEIVLAERRCPRPASPPHEPRDTARRAADRAQVSRRFTMREVWRSCQNARRTVRTFSAEITRTDAVAGRIDGIAHAIGTPVLSSPMRDLAERVHARIVRSAPATFTSGRRSRARGRSTPCTLAPSP